MEMLVGHLFGPIRMGINDDIARKRKTSYKVLNQWRATKVWAPEVREILLAREMEKVTSRQLAEEAAAKRVADAIQKKSLKDEKQALKEQRVRESEVFAQSVEGRRLKEEANKIK